MTISKDINLIKFTNLVVTLSLIVALSLVFAVSINSYISYKFFTVPNYEIKVKRLAVKEEKSYRFIPFLYRKIASQPEKIEMKKESSTSTVQSVISQPPPNIKLIGTVTGEGEKIAIVEFNKKLSLLKEKDKIGNFSVERIDRYEIVITDGVNRYTIPLEISAKKGRSTSYKRISRKTETTQKVLSLTKSEGEYYEISKREVEKQTADLGKLLRYVRIVPVVENGETKGYKFLYVSPRSILYKYGLRSGDFIVSVNGMQVRTAEEAFKIYNMLRNEKTIRLEIDRRGERKVITYEIK